ncbi:MAG TPA: hypothetical protein VFB54_07365 [Burkholderiales bacterium]|nr:hypothetical protein [Burkholderiales bacterium]
MSRTANTEESNAAAMRELAARTRAPSPLHADTANCPCRACFFREDRPRYWTRTDGNDGEVAS